MTAPRAEPDEGVAALALIRAYATRDMFTARHILARWDNGDRGTSFAAVVASTAATVLSRVASGDRNEAARQADEALEVYLGIVARDRAA
jgi:hypothetical protein